MGIGVIPSTITREHVLQALRDIDEHGVPPARGATKCALEHDGRLYPPKLVVSIAARHALGSELDPATFSGGQETNQFLVQRGFRIAEARPEARRDLDEPVTPAVVRQRQAPHSGERCPACKVRVRELLQALFGRVDERHSLGVGALPGDYDGTPHGDALDAIYARLVAHRGYADFVRARQLPPCDYFVPEPGFILEFDESQHFTTPRGIALQSYPSTLPIGFDCHRWLALCQEVGARDPDPPYRDEQRAWYDTLRDFAHASLGLRPTVRLYAGQTAWCRLDPQRRTDLDTFRQLLGIPVVEATRTSDHVTQKRISVRADRGAVIARLILTREWPGHPGDARALLGAIVGEWPADLRVDFLVTCGGFVQFPLSEAVPIQAVNTGSDAALTPILENAVKVAHDVVPADLRARLGEHARYITLGIDTHKDRISTTQNRIREPHAETVIVLDLDTGRHHATAKSYPTPAQERGLIRLRDLKSHFLPLGDGTCAMVLGCHDLSVWNPRSMNARGWRAQLNAEFRGLARERKPTLVLHHPHTADSKMTWRASWKSLERELPSVKHYAGAGRHWHRDGPRSALDETLALTKKGPTVDFVVDGSARTLL